MLIHKLQITNFKSYSGEHTLGPFDHHFNCIIGPNGNGKSNIIDAVLFVFGFKSSKLRQDNLASLIHRSAFATPEKATVRIVFRQDKQLFSVSRSVTKGGTTYYKLDDERVGWGQLREKLVSKRIDLNKNLFIILQGEVERLCQLSPLTMVDYLEYISGSDQFKEPIQAAEKKYIDVSLLKEEKRLSLNVRRKIFDGITEKAGDLAIRIYLHLKTNTLNHLVMKKTVNQNSRHRENLQAELAAKQELIKQVQGEIARIDKAVQERRANVRDLQREIGKIERQLQAVESQGETVGNQVSSLKREICFLSSDRDKKSEEMKRYEKEERELSQLAEGHRDFLGRIRAIKELVSREKELPKLKICEDIQTKLLALKEQENQLAAKNSEKQLSLKQGREKMAILDAKTRQLKQMRQICKAKQNQIKTSILKTEEKIKQIQETIEQLERQLKNKPNQKMQGLSHREKIINEIRNANRLKIICPENMLATLRELVVVEAAYAQVVQTLLPHLDYFIVETVKQAKEVAEYLKKKQIGRMTFLIKQLISPAVKDIAIVQQAPNQTKLMLELIGCSNKDTKNILIWVLGNTLVANSLETAMKVAYYDQKRFRVITTNGQFIDSSGTITKLALKPSQLKEDNEMLTKKLETLHRLSSSLIKRKEELSLEQTEVNLALDNVAQEQRNFDGLDTLILDELQKEIEKETRVIDRNRHQAAILREELQQMKSKLLGSGFAMEKYEESVAMLREVAENQEKVKKIENTASILSNISAKKQHVLREVQACARKIEEKVKAKVAMEIEKERLTREVRAKMAEIELIGLEKQSIQKEKSDMQAQRQKNMLKLSDKQSNTRTLRDQVTKINAAIKSVEYSQIQLKNKMVESLKVIKEFSGIAYYSIYTKYPELVAQFKDKKITQNYENKKVAQNYDNNLQGMFRYSLSVPLGKEDVNFLQTLSRSEMDFIFSNPGKSYEIYQGSDDFLPQSAELQMFLIGSQLKEFKFSHSLEQEKLKQFQKDKKIQNPGHFDFQLLAEYNQAKLEFQQLSRNLSQIENTLNTVKQELISLRNQRLAVFMAHFNEINVQLNNIYARLTGGRAELNFIDSMNPFEGVQFAVRPVNKSWKRVNLLSGGQKTFTSLALIFACEQIKKFPFYFMDEIDAALDYKNTTLLAQYIREKVNTQHIVISLRKNMYQECNRIVGIYKVKDQSRTVETQMADLLQRK